MTTATISKASWQTLDAPNPPCPRSSHQISSLGSRIFLFGGENGPPNSHFGYGLPVPSSSVECIDLDKAKEGWHSIPVTCGTPPSPRLGHGQCIVERDDKVYLYVFGGRQPIDGDLDNIRSLNDFHRLDISSGVWEEIEGTTGEFPSRRSYHQMVSVGQKLYVFAGMINDTRYNDLFVFDTQENRWTRLSPGPMEGRGGPGLCVVGEDRDASLVVVAGFCGRPMSDVWQYRMASDEWLPRRDWTLSTANSIFACGTLSSDAEGKDLEVCVFGGELENFDKALIEKGQDPTLQASLYTNETLVLASDTKGASVRTVDLGSNLPVARGWTAGCSALVEGKRCFVVFGGVREGKQDEPSGVRLGDLFALHI